MHPFSLRLNHANTNQNYTKSTKTHTTKASVHLDNSNKENVADAANIDRYHNKKEEPKRSSKYEASPGIDRRSPTNPLQQYNRNTNAISTHLNSKIMLTSPKATGALLKREPENTRILLKSLDNFLENKENRANSNSKENKAVKPLAKRGVKEESTYSTKTREDQSTTRDTNSRLLSLAEDTAPEEMTIYTRLLTTTKPMTSKNKDSFMHNLEHNYYSPQHNMQKASMDLLAMTNQARKAYLNGPTIEGRLNEQETHAKVEKVASDFQRLLKSRTNKIEETHAKDKTPKAIKIDKNERYRRTEEDFAQEKPKTRYPSTKKLSIDIQEPINIKERGVSKTDKDLTPNTGSYSKSKLAQSYSSLKKEMDSRGLLQKSPTLEGDGSAYRTSLRESSETKLAFKLTSPKAESYEAIEMRRSMRSPKNLDKENNVPQSLPKNNGGQRNYYGSFVETDKEAEHSKAKEKLMGSYSQKKRPLSLAQNVHENETYSALKKKEETRVLISPKQEKANGPSLKDFVTQVNIGSGTGVSTPSESRDSYSQQRKFENISNKSTPKTQDLSEDGYYAHLSKKYSKEKPPKAPMGRKESELWEKKTVPTKKITFRTEEDDHRGTLRRTEEVRDAHVYYMSGLEKYLRGNEVEDDYFHKIYKEHFFQGFQAINFCRYLKPVDPLELEKKKVYLPRRESHKDKKTLIFDLDETLIHCNEDPTMPCDAVIAIKFPHGDTIEAGINIRPYAMECLMELNKYYEIVVFTASHSCYANVALDYLDPEEKYIQHRLFRDHCMTTPEGLYIKDLRILANRDPKDVIIVDNAVYSFGFQLENGIPIIPFYFNKNDFELKSLTSYLKKLAHVPDVREMNRKVFKLHSYAESESAEEVLTNLLAK